MGHGGYHPGAERYGGGKPRLRYIHESLLAQRGTAYDTTPTSTVWTEDMATARGLDEAWSTNARLGHIRDPMRMSTGILARWERILALFPKPTATEYERRLAVAAKFARFGQPFNTSRLMTQAQLLLGTTFVALVLNTVATATTFWPGGTPGGQDNGWYSTVAHIRFQVQQPAGMLDGDFYDTVNSVNAFMDGEAPAWVTWEWYRLDSVQGTIGFFLDSPRNLGGDIFDV